MRNFVVVGAGGIGYHLVPILAKTVSEVYREEASTPNLFIVDGDVVEDHNLARCFSGEAIGENKASFLSEYARSLVDPEKLNIIDVPEFIDPMCKDRFHKRWFRSGVTIFGCVDNHKTRVFLEKECQSFKDSIYVSGGNSLYEGQALLSVRLEGKAILPPTYLTNPDQVSTADANNRYPTDNDCTAEYEARPQLNLTNSAVANAMLGLWYSECVLKAPSEASLNTTYYDLKEGGRVHQFVREAVVDEETLDLESAVRMS